jgi:multicomponent Na+:H+ antiporter subunit G
MSLREAIILTITGIGVAFMLISAIGVVRLPDVFTRMHANGKAATLGISCLMLASGIYYPDYFGRMFTLVMLFFITAPIATTAMARAAYRVRNPVEKFVLHYDEMRQAPPATTAQHE